MQNSAKNIVMTGSLTRYHQVHEYYPHLRFIMLKGEGIIELKFDDEEGNSWIYQGKERGPVHYELISGSNLGGRGTLHNFEGGAIYEGFWSEKDQYKGMWRLHASKTSELP